MALFSLTDIGFKTETRTGVGGDLGLGEYGTNLFRYPIDLGTADRGHYIVFNINEQINTADEFKGKGTNDLPTSQANKASLTNQFGLYDSVSTIKNGLDLGGQALNAAADWLGSKIGINITGSEVWQTEIGRAHV